MEQLAAVSDQLYQFTEQELAAHEFINTAEANFKSISFCAISALGTQPDGARLAVDIAPRRILDPMLWVMKKTLVDGTWLGWQQWLMSVFK